MLSFFLLILARSNYDHYTRECDFGILKKKTNKTKNLGNYSCFCCCLLTFFKISLFKKFFRDTINVSNGLDPDQDRHSGPKLFAKVISRRQKLLLARKVGCEKPIMPIYIHKYIYLSRQEWWERSGSVVECLTQERGVAGLSLTGVTVLWSLSKTHLS